MVQQVVVPVVTIEGKDYVTLVEHKRVVAEMDCVHVYAISDLRRDLDRIQRSYDEDRAAWKVDAERLYKGADFSRELLRETEKQSQALNRIAEALAK